MHERDIAIDNIVKGLTFLIMTDLKEAAGEQHHPRRDADAMDDYIKECKDRAIQLRMMRQHFEDIITGVL